MYGCICVKRRSQPIGQMLTASGCIVLIRLDNQQTSPYTSAKSWPLLYSGFHSSKRPSCRGGAFLSTSLEEGHKMTRVTSSETQRTPIPPDDPCRSPQDGNSELIKSQPFVFFPLTTNERSHTCTTATTVSTVSLFTGDSLRTNRWSISTLLNETQTLCLLNPLPTRRIDPLRPSISRQDRLSPRASRQRNPNQHVPRRTGTPCPRGRGELNVPVRIYKC